MLLRASLSDFWAETNMDFKGHNQPIWMSGIVASKSISRFRWALSWLRNRFHGLDARYRDFDRRKDVFSSCYGLKPYSIALAFVDSGAASMTLSGKCFSAGTASMLSPKTPAAAGIGSPLWSSKT